MKEAHEMICEMEQMGITRYRIAKDTGLSAQSLLRWRAQQVKPQRLTFKALEKYYKKVVK